MGIIRFWDRLPVVVSALGGRADLVSYNALDLLTSPYAGDDLGRLDKVCSSLPGFAKHLGTPGVITLDVIRARLRNLDLEPQAVIERFSGKWSVQYKALLRELTALEQRAGGPISTSWPVWAWDWSDPKDVSRCKYEIRQTIREFEEWLSWIGSVEVATFIERRTFSECCPQHEYDGVLLRKLPFDPNGLSASWLDRPEQSGIMRFTNPFDERPGSTVPFEYGDSIRFSVEKMTGDPRCRRFIVKQSAKAHSKRTDEVSNLKNVTPPIGEFYHDTSCRVLNITGSVLNVSQAVGEFMRYIVQDYYDNGTTEWDIYVVAQALEWRDQTRGGKPRPPAEVLRKAPIWRTQVRGEGIIGMKAGTKDIVTLYSVPNRKYYRPPTGHLD